MSLNVQIKTLLISIIFGVVLYYYLKLNKKIIYNNNKFLKIIGTPILIILITTIYFLVLYKINYGVFHIYEILCIILGYTLIALKNKKWYNLFKVIIWVRKKYLKLLKKDC